MYQLVRIVLVLHIVGGSKRSQLVISCSLKLCLLRLLWHVKILIYVLNGVCLTFRAVHAGCIMLHQIWTRPAKLTPDVAADGVQHDDVN